MIWDELTSPQLEEVDKKTPVILPIAATEQHGPHLPLATDRLIAEHFMQGSRPPSPSESSRRQQRLVHIRLELFHMQPHRLA